MNGRKMRESGGIWMDGIWREWEEINEKGKRGKKEGGEAEKEREKENKEIKRWSASEKVSK